MSDIQDFETLEEAQQIYLDALIEHEEQRFAMSVTAQRIRNRAGKAGLNALAQTSHRKRSTLEAEARVADLADLRKSRATLSYTHFTVVSRLERVDAQTWLDRAADLEWSPADLRREIAASKRQPEGPDVVVKKADGLADKFKGVIDQAAEVGVLDETQGRIEGLASYARAKAAENPAPSEKSPSRAVS